MLLSLLNTSLDESRRAATRTSPAKVLATTTSALKSSRRASMLSKAGQGRLLRCYDLPPVTLVLYTKKVMEKVMKSAEKKLNLSSLLKSFTFPNFWVLTHRPSL